MLELKNVVYKKPEDYKQGWVHGFYDAKPDDGAFYGDLARISHTLSAFAGAGEAARLYNEGYRDGQSIRRSGNYNNY